MYDLTGLCTGVLNISIVVPQVSSWADLVGFKLGIFYSDVV